MNLTGLVTDGRGAGQTLQGLLRVGKAARGGWH